jgi:hypothetical protein
VQYKIYLVIGDMCVYNFESVQLVVFDIYRIHIDIRLDIVAILSIIFRLNAKNVITNKKCCVQNHPKPNRYSDKIDFRQKLFYNNTGKK